MTDIREIKQAEAVESFDEKGILYMAPRTGKCKTTFDILSTRGWKKALIVVPRLDITEGWKADKEKWGWEGEMIFVTTRSINKMMDIGMDCLVLDEIHEYSDNQLDMVDKLVERLPTIALSGTLTVKSQRNIEKRTGLTISYRYSIAQAVEDGILTDYQIFVHSVPLDRKIVVKTTKKGKKYTEKGWFDVQEYIPPKSLLDVKRIGIIQNSISKRALTMSLLEEYKDERVLVFCGTMETVDSLGIPVYHSGDKNEDVFKDFCNGRGDKLATIKMMEAGITITPISKGIINYTSGNPESCAQKIGRFLCREWNAPDKKAEIHIVSSTEEFERDRLKTALLFFDQNKIEYL